MKRFDLYGLGQTDVEAAVMRLRSALPDADFQPHDSEFWGGDYYLCEDWRGLELSLRPNARDEDGVLIHDDHPDHAVVLDASGDNDEAFDELGALPGVTLLRSQAR